jgi:hypothetical protein
MAQVLLADGSSSSQLHENQPMTSSNPVDIERYFNMLQNSMNEMLHELSELWKFDHDLESRVATMQPNHGMKDDRPVGEPSFVIKSYRGNKKERTKEAICT